VHVSWSHKDTVLTFSFDVPAGITAKVGIPKIADQATLVINGNTVIKKGKVQGKNITVTDRFIYLNSVSSGSYSGKSY
jgi:hypothetical protein